MKIRRNLTEAGEITIAELVHGHLERIHPDAMNGLLLIAALLAAHQEITRWNFGAYRALDAQLATHNNAPQWKPAPKVANTTGTPAGDRTCLRHSAAAISMDAEDVLPYRRMFE